MNYEGIVITGTECSGKSTIARELCTLNKNFELVKAITTRRIRDDDVKGEYEYITVKEYKEICDKKQLFINTLYKKNFYGIKKDSLNKTIKLNKIPIMITSPQSFHEFKDILTNYMTFFIDAKDEDLNTRLKIRNKIVNEDTHKIKIEDRKYKYETTYTMNNICLNSTINLIDTLWRYQNIGGVLPKRIIILMIESDMLLINAELDNVSGASYDLTIGDEYYHAGKIKLLSEKEPFLLIEPYDYVIVTSKEKVNFPNDIVGRFDVSISLFCQGIILSNGPQIDPGFRGRLYCLLFNTSNTAILLKRGQHYTTIEFNKLFEPTVPYMGKYQDKDNQ